MTIKVTILLPVYNNKDDIINSIKSIINQTLNNSEWELIIIDDSSDDGTFQIVENFLKLKDNKKYNIKHIRNEINKGTYISLNEGINIAKGRYLTFLGSDDKLNCKMIEKQVNILDNNDKYVATISGGLRENKRLCGESTLFYRKNIINEMGYYDSVRFAADTEFKERIFKVYGKNKVFISNEILYYAKCRPNSLTTSVKTGLISARGVRFRYVRNFKNWHNECQKNNKIIFMEYPLDNNNRPFKVNKIMLP